MTEPSADIELGQLLEAVWRRIGREELVRFAQDLVRIPSVYRPEEGEGTKPTSPGSSRTTSNARTSRSIWKK